MIIQHIGPLVECQMLNVNKVKLLSERTSGVPRPPVIFCFRKKVIVHVPCFREGMIDVPCIGNGVAQIRDAPCSFRKRG